MIDEYDISKVSLNSVRQQIGIVPQECILFEGSIRDNIAMNQPNASTEAIVDAAHAAEAQLHNGIARWIRNTDRRKGSRTKWWTKTENCNCKNTT